MVDDGGLPLLGAQRGWAQPGGVPLVVAPGGLILAAGRQQLTRHRLRAGLLIQFGTNHPQQPTQPALLEVRPVVGQHLLGVSGQHIQPRCLAHDLGELAGDTHHLFNVLATVDGGLVVGVAVLGCGEYHHAGEPAGAELVGATDSAPVCSSIWWGRSM